MNPVYQKVETNLTVAVSGTLIHTHIDDIQLGVYDSAHPQTHLEVDTQVLVTDLSSHSSIQ